MLAMLLIKKKNETKLQLLELLNGDAFGVTSTIAGNGLDQPISNPR